MQKVLNQSHRKAFGAVTAFPCQAPKNLVAASGWKQVRLAPFEKRLGPFDVGHEKQNERCVGFFLPDSKEPAASGRR